MTGIMVGEEPALNHTVAIWGKDLCERHGPSDAGVNMWCNADGQGAYGILAEVESHPFPTDAMLFMDWRDEHTASNSRIQESNRCTCAPTSACMCLFKPILQRQSKEESDQLNANALAFPSMLPASPSMQHAYHEN